MAIRSATSAMTAVFMVSGGKRGKRKFTLVKGANEENIYTSRLAFIITK
jgi:hypothetical protein